MPSYGVIVRFCFALRFETLPKSSHRFTYHHIWTRRCLSMIVHWKLYCSDDHGVSASSTMISTVLFSTYHNIGCPMILFSFLPGASSLYLTFTIPPGDPAQWLYTSPSSSWSFQDCPYMSPHLVFQETYGLSQTSVTFLQRLNTTYEDGILTHQ